MSEYFDVAKEMKDLIDDNVSKVMEKTIVKSYEDEENFIFETIRSFATNVTQRKISKKDIINALNEYFGCKWHDLRNDSDDLPDRGVPVLVETNNNEYVVCVLYHDGWCLNLPNYLQAMPKSEKVIKWKYIE